MMKTTMISIFTAIFLNVLFINNINASNENEKNIAERKITHALEKEIEYPKKARQEGIQGYVNVIFSISEDGSIQIKRCFSNEEPLKDYVVRSIEKICLKDLNFDKDELYSIKLNYKLR